MTERDHWVYRAYDDADACLYVGCTSDLRTRRYQHSRTSEWFPSASRFRLTGPLPRLDAYQLEAQEIAALNPLHNRYAGSRITDPRLVPAEVVYLSTAQACQVLGCLPSRVSRWVQAGYLTAELKMPGLSGAFLFHPDEVERVRKLRAEKKAA